MAFINNKDKFIYEKVAILYQLLSLPFRLEGLFHTYPNLSNMSPVITLKQVYIVFYSHGALSNRNLKCG